MGRGTTVRRPPRRPRQPPGRPGRAASRVAVRGLAAGRRGAGRSNGAGERREPGAGLGPAERVSPPALGERGAGGKALMPPRPAGTFFRLVSRDPAGVPGPRPPAGRQRGRPTHTAHGG